MFRAGWMLCLLGLKVFAQSADEIPKENPYQSESDVDRGKRLFLGHCAPCHGPEGNGGKGANLARPALPRAADDPSLFKVIRNGIPGTEMPGAWEMNPHETWQVAAFVRTLGRAAVDEPVSGDRFRGEQLFRGKGNCMTCHTVGREGGRTGPVLSDVGYRRSAGYLRKTLLDPQSTLPEGFLYVELATKAGKRISGVRINEDTYSIQVRDLSDQMHSFWKTELAQLRKLPNRTPMPSYKDTLAGAELEDLIAYLTSLRGAQ
jgi:putative heme-binding domain-containing protein